MPITNVVEAVLGRKQLKWDAFWHLFKWLLDSQEGHGLGKKIVDEFSQFSLGCTFGACGLKSEHQFSDIKDGKGKWADLVVAIPSLKNPTHVVIMDDIDLRSPGGKRKLDNLTSYRQLARKQFPSALIRAVVLTNACDGAHMAKAYAGLGEEASDFSMPDGWKLLPIRVVGGWVNNALKNGKTESSAAVRLFLLDFVDWSTSLDSRPTAP